MLAKNREFRLSIAMEDVASANGMRRVESSKTDDCELITSACDVCMSLINTRVWLNQVQYFNLQHSDFSCKCNKPQLTALAAAFVAAAVVAIAVVAAFSVAAVVVAVAVAVTDDVVVVIRFVFMPFNRLIKDASKHIHKKMHLDKYEEIEKKINCMHQIETSESF